MIDWKKIKKIDAHIHLMPPDVIEANKEYGGNFIDFGDVRDYLEIMDKYLEENGYVNDFTGERHHHEIYLSDPRKVAPEKCKTIIYCINH